jgi:hypothetical protein
VKGSLLYIYVTMGWARDEASNSAEALARQTWYPIYRAYTWNVNEWSEVSYTIGWRRLYVTLVKAFQSSPTGATEKTG